MKPTRYLINSIKFILIPNNKKLKTSLFKLYFVIFDNIQNLVILFFPSSHHLYKLMLNAFSVQDVIYLLGRARFSTGLPVHIPFSLVFHPVFFQFPPPFPPLLCSLQSYFPSSLPLFSWVPVLPFFWPVSSHPYFSGSLPLFSWVPDPFFSQLIPPYFSLPSFSWVPTPFSPL